MQAAPDTADEPFVSTGVLPSPERVQALVDEACRRYRSDTGGAVSRVYLALAEVRPELFGICVAGTSGEALHGRRRGVRVPDHERVEAVRLRARLPPLGPDEARRLVGVDATDLPFDSLAAVERGPDGRTNPMVNPGAIATTSHVAGRGADERWELVLDGLSRFAGRSLSVDRAVYEFASATKGGLGTFAPLLDAAGNSVKGQLAAVFLSRRLGLDLFASKPAE